MGNKMNKYIAAAARFFVPNTVERMELEAFNEYALGLYPHTPDITYLEEKESHLLFVCDDMQEGLTNSKLIKDGTYKATAFTIQQYGMWVRLRDMLPVPLRIGKTSLDVPARIKGQLWIVPTEVLISLDNYRKNGVEFRRQRVRVEVPYREETFTTTYSDPYTDNENDRLKRIRVLSGNKLSQDHYPWMYMGKRTYWNDQISQYEFKRVNRYYPKGFWTGAPYYCFTRLEGA